MADPIDPRAKQIPIDLNVVEGIVFNAPAIDPASEVLPEHGRRLLQITSALADAVSPSSVQASIVDQVAATLGASTCALWIHEAASLRMVRSVGYSARATSVLVELPIDHQPSMPVLDAFRRSEPVWIPSQRALLERYPDLAGCVTPGRAYRVSCLPLVADGDALGVLGITFDDEREASDGERSFLLSVASFAAHALARLHMVERERESRLRADAIARRMTILSQASRAFSEAHIKHGERLQRIVREVGRSIGATTSIALVRDDGRLHGIATYHPDPEAQALAHALAENFPLRPGEGISGRVLQSGQSTLLRSIDPDTVAHGVPAAYHEYFERFPIHAAIVAPLRVRETIIGTISATRVRPRESFDFDDLELLEALAERAASAIENSRLHAEAEAARRRADQLYRFANAAVAAQTLSEVFDAALTAMIEGLRATRASILLRDDDGVMRFQAWRGLSDRYRAAVEGHSPWSPEDGTPQPVLVSDCQADAAWASYRELFRSEGIGAMAFIPLLARGQLLGKFMVYYPEPQTFAIADVEVARAIASHLASMIARFRAAADLERTVRDSELFAGVLAHDLRNPLGAVISSTELALICDDNRDERSHKALTQILSSAERMADLISQLLDFTRARVGGGITLLRRPANLIEIAKQATAELELVHLDRKLVVTAHGDTQGAWDTNRLLQVISNLVANACQHGDPGCDVTITIDGGATDTVTVSVHNAGTIPAAALAHLFDPVRGRAHRRSDARGLGLGLYIVREIVHAHRGTVDVASLASEGTTFVVRLPRK